MDILGGVLGVVGNIVTAFTSAKQSAINYSRQKRLLQQDFTYKSQLLDQAGALQREAEQAEINKLQLQKVNAQPLALQKVSTTPEGSFSTTLSDLIKSSYFPYVLIGIAGVILLLFLTGKK